MKALTELAQGILAYQSTNYGYVGMMVTPEECVLTGEPPWQDFADSGYHRVLGGTASKKRTEKPNIRWQKPIILARRMYTQQLIKH